MLAYIEIPYFLKFRSLSAMLQHEEIEFLAVMTACAEAYGA